MRLAGNAYPAWSEDSGNPRPPSGKHHERRVVEVRQWLGELPELYALLPLFVLPGVGVPQEEQTGGMEFKSTPPVNIDVLDLANEVEKRDTDSVRSEAERERDRNGYRWEDEDARRGLRGIVVAKEPARFREGVLPFLVQWTRLIDGELWDEEVEHDPPAEVPTVSGECDFLLAQFDWISKQPWWLEFYAEVKQRHRQLADATHTRPSRTRLVCIDPLCGWDVVAVPGAGGRRYFRCTGCGEAWSDLEIDRMAKRKRPRTLTECAKITGVSVRSLRTAVAQRTLRPARREANTDYFNLDDVVIVAAQIIKGRHAGRTRTRAS